MQDERRHGGDRDLGKRLRPHDEAAVILEPLEEEEGDDHDGEDLEEDREDQGHEGRSPSTLLVIVEGQDDEEDRDDIELPDEIGRKEDHGVEEPELEHADRGPRLSDGPEEEDRGGEVEDQIGEFQEGEVDRDPGLGKDRLLEEQGRREGDGGREAAQDRRRQDGPEHLEDEGVQVEDRRRVVREDELPLRHEDRADPCGRHRVRAGEEGQEDDAKREAEDEDATDASRFVLQVSGEEPGPVRPSGPPRGGHGHFAHADAPTRLASSRPWNWTSVHPGADLSTLVQPSSSVRIGVSEDSPKNRRSMTSVCQAVSA